MPDVSGTPAAGAPPANATDFNQRGRMSVAGSVLMIAPVVVLLGWTFFLPIGGFLAKSFTEPTWTLQHYREIASDPFYWQIMLRTLRVAFAATIIALVLGYPIALLMTQLRGWVLGLVTACVLIPLWTSVLVRTYAWIVLLQREGIINNALVSLGFTGEPLTLLYTEGAVLVAMSQVLMPFMVLPIYATMRNIAPDLTRAAINLGANRFRAFLAVTVPLSLPGVWAGCLIVFVMSLGFFITPALIGGPRTLMIATLISEQATEFLNWPLAGAISLVLLVLALGTTIAFKVILGVDRVTTND